MTAKRLLLAVLPLIGGLGSAAAQNPMLTPPVQAPPTSTGNALLPSTAPTSPGAAMPTTMPYSTGTADASTMHTLTAPPGLPQNSLPQGSVTSPWSHASNPYCCGPTGGNGPVTYELYARTGPSFIVGGGPELTGAIEFGWQVGGGGRTLLFNNQGDAAWVLDLGGTYTYNGGNERILDVFARQPRDQAGALLGPDEIQPFRLRGVTRTSFNYSIGRDWFLNGPGVLGFEQAWNSRYGVDVGGRYGTIRLDLVPEAARDSYFRRYNVTNGLSFGAHYNAETPMGNWILFTGARIEYGFNWSNVAPPLDGNFQDLNLLLTVGVRF